MAEQTFISATTNFNGGELSPRMMGRSDTSIYPVALAEMLNFVPSLEGPAVKRPGYRSIRAAATTSTWLSAFIFSRTQGYVLEWADLVLRFFTNGGRIESDPDTPYEVVVPYGAAEAPFVASQQSKDRLYLAHRAHAFAALTRTGAETFTFAAETLENGPFADLNTDKTLTIAFSATSGSVTGYASAAMFTAEHAGELFYVETRDFAEIPQWEADRAVGDGVLRAAEGRVYQRIGGAARTGTVIPTHTEGAAWDGDGSSEDSNGKGPFGVQWLYVYDRYGIVRIDTVDSSTKVEGTVLRRLPNSAGLASTYDNPIGYTPPYTIDGGVYPRFEVPEGGGLDDITPADPGGDFTSDADGVTGYALPGTWRWAHAAISDAAGWPVEVVLAWGRLVLFTDFEVIGSVIGDYGGGRCNFAEFNEQTGENDTDMAFRRLLDISNAVLWAREDRGNILIGTLDGEYLVGPINSSAAVDGENIQCVKQTRHGAAQAFPVDAAGETIFVQAAGKKLRNANYSFQSDRYEAPLMNIWSRHILGPGCIQLAWEGESEEMLWALRSDGVMAAHAHAPEQEIKGFSRVAHGAGPVLSTVCIPSEDGTLDEQWVLVRNEVTGVKRVEQRAPWWIDGSAKETAFFVDSGVTVEAPESATLTGLDWLAGRAVAVLSDGAILRNLSVSDDGELVLPTIPAVVSVGLAYTAAYTSLKPELRDGRGHTMQGVKQRLFKIALRLLETLGVKVDALAGATPEEMIKRGVEVPMGDGPGFFSGDIEPRAVGGGWERHGQYRLVHDDPVPCVVVGAQPRVQVTE